MSDDDWYYAREGKKFGPMNFRQIYVLVEKGEVRAESLVWKPGMCQWMAAGDLGVFSEVLGPGQVAVETATVAVNAEAAAPVLGYAAFGAQAQDWHYGGFWARVLAWIVDWLIGTLAGVAIGYVLSAIATIWAHAPAGPQQFMLESQIGLACRLATGWLYPALTISSGWQATLGKMMLGLKVTDLAGARIGFWRATAREWSKYLSVILVCVGYLMVAFDDRKRGLHDHIAGTMVVYKV